MSGRSEQLASTPGPSGPPSCGPAPIATASLARSLEPMGSATMLPAEAYQSPAMLAWERRNLFAGTWSCAGREEDLRTPRVHPDRPVTQRAIRTGDVGVLLTWSPDDELRAFANTCRHRGHELLGEGFTADRASVVCPYHAWTYDLAGQVRARARIAATTDDDLGLVELPVERWHGWVFVHAAAPLGDPAVPAFDLHLGALAKIVEPYVPERLVRRARHTYEVAANWKVITENYHECYHCPLIHPELCQVSPPDSGENYDLPGLWVGGWMDLRDGMTTMSITGRSGGRAIVGAPAGRVEYLGLLPDLLLSLHPDYVMTHRLVPLTADRTVIECSWYFPGEDIDPAYAVEFWDLTNRQDWAACESVQRGLASPHFRPGPFAPNEDAVHRYVGMIARAYATPADHGDARSDSMDIAESTQTDGDESPTTNQGSHEDSGDGAPTPTGTVPPATRPADVDETDHKPLKDRLY